MKYLGECFKLLPKNLQSLELNLLQNSIGRNVEDMMYLNKGIKQIPTCLQNLRLSLGGYFIKESDIWKFKEDNIQVLNKIKSDIIYT